MSHTSMSRRDLAMSSNDSAATPARTSRQPAPRHWLRRIAAAVGIVAGVAGLGLWGHVSHWTIPKFSSLIGQRAADTEDWCKEHSVPESACIECNASLVAKDKDFGWCKEHGISQCPLHHPEVAQVKSLPQVTPADLERARNALMLVPRPENSSRCKLHLRRIQFASTKAVEKVGLDIAVVQQQPIVEAILANGEVGYDQIATAHLSSRVAGTIWRVEKQIGDKVQKGDVLALVDAVEIGRAKGEFMQAIAHRRLKHTTVERLRPLVASSSIPERSFREAEAAHQEAHIRLLSAHQTLVNLGMDVRLGDFDGLDTEQTADRIRFLGLPPKIANQLDAEATTSNLFPLRSPLDGTIVDRHVVAGEVVDTSAALFTVSNVNCMWLTLSVRQEDVEYLSLGQTTLFRPGDKKNQPEIKGSIGWISTAADEQTRSVKVRVDLPNENGRLRANTFGIGRIILREEPNATVIPSEAVHWDGCCNVVFVRDKDYLRDDAAKFFHIRKVRLGVVDGDVTEIIAGLMPGEVIASKNSVVLEAQLLKSNLGAGCGCCAH